MDIQELDNRFNYHKPTSELTAAIHESVRAGCLKLADQFNRELPEGREKAVAMTKIEEAMMWANAATARHRDGTCTCH